MGYKRTCLLAGVAMASLSGPTFAQSTQAGQAAAQPGQAEQTAAQSRTPDEAPGGDIIVTAQKRAESINNVPISITALSQDTLDKQGLRNVTELARATPGLTFRSNDGFDNPTIAVRGVISNVGAATTGVYIDETPVAARSACFFCGGSAFPQLFDLERVEVLRGPQGTLFGAGSQGGTIRFITPSPSLTRFSSYARSEVAATRYGEASYEAGAAVGGPIVQDKLGFRASVWGRRDGGYIDRVDRTTGQIVDKNVNRLTSYVARATLAWKPVEAFTVTPSFFYQKNGTDGRGLFQLERPRFQTDRLVRETGTDRQAIGSVKAEYDAGSFAVTSVTSYYDRKQFRIDDYSSVETLIYSGGTVDFLPGYVAQNELNTTQKNWTQELRASSDDLGRFAWTIGGFYTHNKSGLGQGTRQDLDDLTIPLYGIPAIDFFGIPPVGPNGDFSYLDRQDQVDKEIAGFGEVSYKLTPELKMTAGVRVSSTRFSVKLDRAGPEAGGDVAVRNSLKETPVTPRFSVAYQRDSSLLYGTVAKGYRIGGGNVPVSGVPFCGQDLQALGIADVPATYGSDTVWSYEAGAKHSFAGRRGQIAGSVYQIDWSNIQSNVLLPTCLYNYTDNVGRARSRGFDLQASFRPVRGLDLSGTVGYTDAKYRDTVSAGGDPITLAGQRLPVSRWTATGSAEYGFPLSAASNGYLRGDYQYNSAIQRNPGAVAGADPLTSRTDPLNIINVRAGVRINGLDLSVFTQNLLDKRPQVLLQRDTQTSDTFRQITIRPRTIGLTVTNRF